MNVYLKKSRNKYTTSPNINNEKVEFNKKLFLTIAKLEFVNIFSMVNSDLDDIIFTYNEQDKINNTNMRIIKFVKPLVSTGPNKKMNIRRIADAFR